MLKFMFQSWKFLEECWNLNKNSMVSHGNSAELLKKYHQIFLKRLRTSKFQHILSYSWRFHLNCKTSWPGITVWFGSMFLKFRHQREFLKGFPSKVSVECWSFCCGFGVFTRMPKVSGRILKLTTMDSLVSFFWNFVEFWWFIPKL